MHHRRFGTHPDIPHARDYVYSPSRTTRLPRAVDLRPGFPPVRNQLSLNSCSAHAIGAAIWYEERQMLSPEAPAPSRLFIYYNERSREGEVRHNASVSLRDGYKAVASQGVCPENMWPYRLGRFAKKPPRACYEAARSVRALVYHRLHRDLEIMKACLAEGSPFTLGVSVHGSFMSERVKKTGVIPMPPRGDKLMGGHAMLVVGYHDASERFIVRNSWGRQWGLKGYGTVPYEFALKPSLSWDFWTCRRVGKTIAEHARRPRRGR